ncbi:MAG TPA: hypothetical protein VFY23_05260 [Candidatus Limnocylindrales bacterium]|nr:hypothetical protein [Candidatus Limnocylindrales bacterium]
MKRLAFAIVVASLAAAGSVAAVAAADPTPTPPPAPSTSPVPLTGPAAAQANRPTQGVMIPAILGMTHEELQALRVQGLTLAEIAEQRGIDPQVLVDALVGQWGVRIDARLAAGMISSEQADQLHDNLAVIAKGFVHQEPLGGMRGAAVGAGPAMGGQGGQAGQGAGRRGGAGGYGPQDGSGRGGGYRGGRGATTTP